MSEITLVRQHAPTPVKAEADAARRFLFGHIDGLGERGKRQWRRFVGSLLRLEPGEMVEIKTHKARSGPFHRRHFLIEQRVFEAQERIVSFDDLRLWLKLGAGHVTWMSGPRGGVVPVPKSISYSAMEEGEMREFHEAVIAFLRTEHAIKYLWPKLSPADRELAIESVLVPFEE